MNNFLKNVQPGQFFFQNLSDFWARSDEKSVKFSNRSAQVLLLKVRFDSNSDPNRRGIADERINIISEREEKKARRRKQRGVKVKKENED